MKKILRVLSRLFMTIPIILLQLLWYLLLFYWLKDWTPIFQVSLIILQVLSVIFILNKREESNYKALWLAIIIGLPLIGTLLYIMLGNKSSSKSIRRKIIKNNPKDLNINNSTIDVNSISTENKRAFNSLQLVNHLSKNAITHGDKCKYYPIGEKIFPDMIKELKKAKHFIFIEYFIIEKGTFWDSIVAVLEEKVKEGVDVRILYDDIGSISTFSQSSRRKLNKKGIKCIAFNPIILIKSALNNRDHRKMMIIDNNVCFSGGINLADEYINAINRFGHWKDIGFCIEGEQVENYTHMFSLIWNAYSKNKIIEKELYTPKYKNTNDNSYMISYCDMPYNKEPVSSKLYIDMLSQAKDYAYFYTPYLILNDSLKEAFIQAAQRGIDVRIIIPGVPDKKTIYLLTQKFAYNFVKNNVKVYTYTPGFLHAKASIIDDKLCTIGSVNLDYRSLFLNFENNSVFFNTKITKQLKDDFLATVSDCKEIKKEDIKINIFKRIYIAILNVFSPLF